MLTIIGTAFSSLGFIFKHWQLVLAFAAIGGMGIEGFHLARAWDEKAALVAEAETMKHRLATITLLQASDAKRADADAAALSTLKDTANDTPKNTGACLDRAAVGRLRAVK
jgi:hypothetical protein